MNGLDLMLRIATGAAAQPPICATLDFRLAAVDEGAARFEGTPRAAFDNPHGTTHGGWAATLLDSAMGCAVMTVLDADHTYTTAHLSIHLVRAITATTGAVVCEGRVVHRGRRVATAEATLRDRAGALLAHATTTCVILPRG